MHNDRAHQAIEMVKISPTWKPQSLNAMRRLQRVLERNLMTRNTWKKESGYIYKIGSARLTFLSGANTSNVVGATASVLLQCDEAQDVSMTKWDKEVNPMSASTNATRVFWGTAWTSNTLLYREKMLAIDKQKKDGQRRLFIVDADTVRKEVPAYGDFVDGEISKLGAGHPFVKTQYYSQEIDAEGGMFPPDRISLMYGKHKRLDKPQDDRVYAFLIDVAGEDDAASILDITLGAATLSNPDRDLPASWMPASPGRFSRSSSLANRNLILVGSSYPWSKPVATESTKQKTNSKKNFGCNANILTWKSYLVPNAAFAGLSLKAAAIPKPAS